MKRLIIGILAILLVVGIYFYFKKDQYSTVNKEEVNFSVEDETKITRIHFENRLGQEVQLTRKGDNWLVNDKMPAFQPLVDKLINEVLTKIDVKGPVPGPAQQNVIRAMVVDAVHVRVYNGNDILKEYYVGGPNPTNTGTYIHYAGAKTPYIGFLPSTKGYFTENFHMVPEDWYNRSIFDLKSDEIRKVSMINYMHPEESFSIVRKDSNYTLSPPIAGETINQSVARSYFSLFVFKNFEGFPDYLEQSDKDSIKKSTPLMKLTVTSVDGTSQFVNIFEKGNKESNTLIDKKGNVLAYDPERYFATYSGFDGLVTIQDYTFGKIMATRSDFYRD